MREVSRNQAGAGRPEADDDAARRERGAGSRRERRRRRGRRGRRIAPPWRAGDPGDGAADGPPVLDQRDGDAIGDGADYERERV